MVYNSSSAACPSKQPAPKTRFIALLRARPRNLSTIFGKILRDLFCTFHKNFLRPVCASPAERFLEVGSRSACSRNFFRPRLRQTGGHSDGEFLASAENDRHSADTRCGERAYNAYAAVSDAKHFSCLTINNSRLASMGLPAKPAGGYDKKSKPCRYSRCA
jgi:hypothetical protein